MHQLKPALVALTLALPLPALAAYCSDWNTEEFFRQATVADVETCLATGADLEAQGLIGLTPLHAAAWSDTPAIVQALIDAGANLEARSKEGSATPLHCAAEYSEIPAIVQTLIERRLDLVDSSAG